MLKPVISADSHIVEPPNCYVDYIDPKFRDVAPYVGKNKHDVDSFIIKGMKNPLPLGLLAGCGMSAEELKVQRNANFDGIRRGSWSAKDRIADMDRDGMGGEIIYASVGMVLCLHEDFDYKKACFDAYNRWLQEYCADVPDRLFGLAQVAVNNVDQAIKDFHTAKEMGHVGIMMPGNPAEEDYDHAIYDPLWETAVELDLPICFHILTSKGASVEEVFKPPRGHSLNGFMNIIRGVQDIIGLFVLGGVFARHPKLKMAVAEGDAGWVPHYMYRMDHAYLRLGANLHKRVPELPSHYIRNNISFTFQDDHIAFLCKDLLNIKRLIWASDYPHTDSTWPRSQEVLSEHTSHMTEDEKNLVRHDNVKEWFNLKVA